MRYGKTAPILAAAVLSACSMSGGSGDDFSYDLVPRPVPGRPSDNVNAGLTARQVRYALRGLVSSGSVEMVGKQGVRGTKYQLTGGSTRLRSAQSRKSPPKGQKSS